MSRLVMLALVLPLAAPAAADGKARPGAPAKRSVSRALAQVAPATPAGAAKRVAQRARRAYARRRTCAASALLGRHHVLLARKRQSTRVRAADRRGTRARAVLLRRLPAGKACGGPPSVAVDRSAAKPDETLPPIAGKRPVATMTDATGAVVEFAANELLVVGTQAKVDALVRRWRGRILRTTPIDDERTLFLVRITTSRADAARLSADLDALAEAKGGALTVSSEQGLDLLAAAGREARRGADVGLNYVGEGSAIAAGSSFEALNGPDGFSLGSPGWDANAFTWKHMSAASTQGVGVPEAWQLLARSGRTANKVGLAVLDMGFSPVAQAGDFGEPLTAISNVPFNDALENDNAGSCGTPCPWHGSNVANAAFAVPDNRLGVAGTGGPVAKRIVVFTFYDFFTSIAAIYEARIAGARVVNMSYGARVPAALGWSVLPFDLATRAARGFGLNLVAAAGNDKTDVDDEDCFITCWEEAWWTPCENAGVFCVGALGEDRTTRADYSNYGGEHVDLFAPGTVLVGMDPATPQKFWPSGVHKVSGTSFAAPYLAGVLALVRAANPSLGPGGAETLIKQTAKASGDAKVKRYVNALEAVRRALPRLIAIEAPVQGGTLQKGGPVTFSAFVHDPAGRTPASVTWTRQNGAVLGSGATFSTDALDYGPHRITARATFSDGTVTSTVDLVVGNTPPEIRIQQPAAGARFVQGERVSLLGTSGDLNQGRLREDQLTWLLDGAPVATGHAPALDLTTTTGDHTLTLRGVDDAGATVSDAVTIGVDPKGPGSPPSVAIASPANNEVRPLTGSDAQGSYAEFDFRGTVSDPDGDPLTFTWTEVVQLTSGPQPAVTRATVEDPGVLRVYFKTCNDQGHDWTLSVSDGTHTRSATVRIGFQDVVC